MVPAEDNSGRSAQEQSVAPEIPSSGIRRRRTVRPIRLHLHQSQRKSLARAAVYLILLLGLLVLWYLMATQQLG
jgi:hypothetical protein